MVVIGELLLLIVVAWVVVVEEVVVPGVWVRDVTGAYDDAAEVMGGATAAAAGEKMEGAECVATAGCTPSL